MSGYRIGSYRHFFLELFVLLFYLQYNKFWKVNIAGLQRFSQRRHTMTNLYEMKDTIAEKTVLSVLVLFLFAGGVKGADTTILTIDPEAALEAHLTLTAQDQTDQMVGLSRMGMTKGPDLNLGYNDFIDIRLNVPEEHAGDVLLYYGVTKAGASNIFVTTGFDDTRMVTLSGTNLVKDGEQHVYRLYMGLEKWWRGELTDINLRLADAGDTVIELVTVQVGDEVGPEYINNYTPKEDEHTMESKHFVFIWNDFRAASNGVNEATAYGNLRNAEEVRALYVNHLRLKEPLVSDKGRFKVRFQCMAEGFWGGGNTFNIHPNGLGVDPPNWVIPHEFGHVILMAQGGGPGETWVEASPNYVREQWLCWYDNLFPETSNLEKGFTDSANYYLTHGIHYYLCWPLLCYIEENPDNLTGLGFGIHADLWQKGRGETIYETLQKLVPEVSVKDIVGYYARRNVTWDYRNQVGMRKNVPYPLQAEFRQRADDPSWWQVPLEMAPMQSGYTIQQLVPEGAGDGRVVTVNFHGLQDKKRGSDWRASLVVVNDGGDTRYSSLWNAGTNTITLAADENEVYLVVAGTPDEFIRGDQNDGNEPYQWHPQRQRMLYEIQVTGATPRESAPTARGRCHVHPNGGGTVADTARVAPTAYVGPRALVLGTANVLDTVRIEDYAVVCSNAVVSNTVVISGHAFVGGTSVIRGNAKVRDYARVVSATVGGHARILDHGIVDNGAQVRDFATVKGKARQGGKYAMSRDPKLGEGSYVGGDAVMDGDHTDNRTATNGFQYSHQPWRGNIWIDQRTAPERVYMGYPFTAQRDSIAKDYYGTVEGYLVGEPTWVETDGVRKGFLELNGSEYIILQRSLSDFDDITVSVWVKPKSSKGKQPVWTFGADTDTYMQLEIENGTPVVIARKGNKKEKLTAAATIPEGAWTHLTVSLADDTGTMCINGKEAAKGTITIDPDQLLAANVNRARQQNYLGRGSTGKCFTGALDNFSVYSKGMDCAKSDVLKVVEEELDKGELKTVGAARRRR
jgi:carbonic anhydrase/acetyltransferase-like protein (isoleucine patch superfamily)